MNDYSVYAPEAEAGLSGALILFYILYMLVMMAINVGTYVLQSVSLYTISKRRGINRPWLSWIPVGSAWILGCISDQYQYVVKGRVKNKRKALLVLNILMSIIGVLFIALYVAFIVLALMDDNSLDAVGAGVFLAIILASLIVSGISIAAAIIRYMSLYDLYNSCEPKNSVLYLVLGILVNITLPIFLFICRNKDLGMPPRKPEPAACIPQQSVYPAEEPAWQPPEPPEPWENNPEE